MGNLSIPEIESAQDYALAAAAKPFLGDIGFKIMALAALFSTSSAINATLYGEANVSYLLEGIGMLASASSLIIYVAVNACHLRLLKETGAKSYLIWASLLSNFIFFGVLTYYEFMNSKFTLGLLALTVVSCFAVEWVCRRYSGRVIKERTG